MKVTSTTDRRRALELQLVAAAGLAILIAGCGDDGGRHDSGTVNVAGQSLLTNYNEHDFAGNPDFRANPDDIVTLQLEDPAGSYDDEFDTGLAEGVDVVPYNYLETTERAFCWKVAGDESQQQNHSGSEMQLIDDATGTMVLRVEEGGECVTQTIPAGHYSAVFRHGPNAEDDRDLVFIVPRSGSKAKTRQDSGAGSGESPPPPAAQAPYCPFAQLKSPDNTIPPFFPAALMQIPVAVGLAFFYMPNGGCTDVSLIRDDRVNLSDSYRLFIYPGFKARVYEDLYFRGPRKTASQQGDPSSAVRFDFAGPGSMALVVGNPSENRDWLIFSKGCVQCDLSGIDLDGVDLHGAWLVQSDLSHASLNEADLGQATALGTVFKSAFLQGADLREAALEGATFDSAGFVDGSEQVYPAADLSGANLEGALLANAVMTDATLTDAIFSGASAPDIDLRRISAAGADFQGAILTSALLTNADLTDTRFDGARLDGARLQGSDLTQANLSMVTAAASDLSRITAVGADFQGADLTSALLTDANLAGSRFDGAQLDRANLRDSNLTNAILAGVTAVRADLRRISANNANFRNATLSSALLTEARLNDTAFDRARLQGVNLQGASLQRARLPEASLEGALLHRDSEHLAAFIDEAYMADANLNRADFTGAQMRRIRFYGRNASAVGASFDNARLDNATLSGADFTGASFRSASLDYAACVNCKFNTALLGRTAAPGSDATSFYASDLRGADFTQARVDGCNFIGALVSFEDTTPTFYSYGQIPDLIYSANFGPSRMEPVRNSATVRCPNSEIGPCDTREKLTARLPTPTPTSRPPTATPAHGCTPRSQLPPTFCPTATLTPAP